MTNLRQVEMGWDCSWVLEIYHAYAVRLRRLEEERHAREMRPLAQEWHLPVLPLSSKRKWCHHNRHIVVDR